MIQFRPLTNNDLIGRCTEMLPNKMQCYKGADFELSDPSNESFENRQVCRFHAKLINQIQLLPKTEQTEQKTNEDNLNGNSTSTTPTNG